MSHVSRDQQEEKRETRTGTSAATGSAWIRRLLSDSVYLWACGVKADKDDDDITLSERFIGWLILSLQGIAYAMLIILARRRSSNPNGNDHGDESEEAKYLLPSVGGAVYLLIASTTHDLRAGFSLLVDSTCASHRVFGLGLLIVYGIMISAAMTVLMSTSEDSVAVVLNAVTAIFIADLDEKALKFLATVPRKWRLFWTIYPIGISFAFAVVAILYIGDLSPLLEQYSEVRNYIPTWYIWVVNPGAVTISSYILSTGLQNVSESYSGGFQGVDQLTLELVVSKAFRGFWATIERAKEGLRKRAFFYATLGLWILQGVGSWVSPFINHDIPLAFFPNDGEIEFTGISLSFIFVNAVLATGLAMKVLVAFLPCHKRVTPIPEPCRSSDGMEDRQRCGSCADSRVPSLLVGWGAGYWVNSLLCLLSFAMHKGGWDYPPLAVSMIGYVVLPFFAIASVFMVSDLNFLGSKFGSFIKPAVEIMRDRRGVVYWIFMSLFRDAFVIWMLVWTLFIWTAIA